MDKANAFPKKQFFWTCSRAILLEDCILDLIDNSIDSILKTEDIDIAKQILVTRSTKARSGGTTYQCESPIHRTSLRLRTIAAVSPTTRLEMKYFVSDLRQMERADSESME